MSFVKRLRRKISYIFHDPYKELARLHDEYAALYPNMACFVFDRLSLEIMFNGVYEKDYLLSLARHVFNSRDFKRTICLDVGAHVGNHSLFFSNYFDSVYSFEPHPETVELLKFNARKIKNIITNNYGLSNSNVEAEILSEAETSTGSSRINEDDISADEFRARNIEQVNKVHLRVFDDIFEFKELYHKISYIKLDVEEHESKVIQGMENFLKQYDPIITLELHQKSLFTQENQITAEVILKLTEYGYIFYYEVIGNKLHQIKLLNNFESKNYVMVLASKRSLDI